MGHNGQDFLQKEYVQIIRKRRILAGVFTLLTVGICTAVGLLIWNHYRAETLVLPKYDKLDPESPQYWQERSQFNIDYIDRQHLPEPVRTKHLRTLILGDISAANRQKSSYDRVRAVTDIALLLAKNDIDINIDSTVRGMEEKESAYEICGRIYVSQALMHLRLNDLTAARTAVADYIRLLVAHDLKLDSPINELSFCGTVTALSVLGDSGALSDFFQKHSAYSHRIGADKRMRAFRIIAGELARTGSVRQAVELLKNIPDTVEFCRACQLIIAMTARPLEIKPLEPVILSDAVFQYEGQVLPLKNEQVAKNAVEEILDDISHSDSVDQQADLLIRLSGSRLMCDPDIHKLFKTVLKETKHIEDLTKTPALRILDEPLSDTIRTALKMPPLPEKKRIGIDTAQENWNVSWGAYADADNIIVPEFLKQISDVRTFRIFTRAAQGYLTVSRVGDAVKVLQKAEEVAAGMNDPDERVASLLTTAEQQIGAGDISSARNTLLKAGLPQTNSTSAAENETSKNSNAVYTEKILSELSRLQIISRFFDDALKTVQHISSEASRNDDYAFLVQELVQVGLADEAEKITEKITDTAIKAEKKHIMAILANGLKPASKEHFQALKVFWADNWEQQRDDDLVRCIKQLIRRGLLQTAPLVAVHIKDSKTKSENTARIAVEYLQLWTAYSSGTEQHQAIRSFLLKQAFEVSDSIPDILTRTQTQQKIVTTMLPAADEISGLKEKLTKTVNGLLADSSPFMTFDCKKNGTPLEIKAQLLTELLLQKIALERVVRNDAAQVPFVDVNLDKNLYTEIRKGIDIAVELLNETEMTLVRGTALNNLGLILLQIGRNQTAAQMLKEADATANELTDKTESVSVIISIPAVLQLLKQSNSAREVFHRLAMMVSDTFVMKRNNLESVLYWRMRDMELDRIIRKMIQLDYIADAAGFSVMIGEPPIRDRLQRSISYIYLDMKRFPEAEASARRITNNELRTVTIQDVLFLRRKAEKEQSKGESKETK
ncbi:hypothetical protein FACS18942_00790 [Planctomycetales bacterium]|nr:hypothetical protein FACS18942_00790 [Planctomycetales bacterium]GHT34632.1 hypothetical protein FACS189427_02300 [Planctomycetales bacterium]